MAHTVIPFRRPAPAPEATASPSILASAWLAGLLLLAALFGAADGHGSSPVTCPAPVAVASAPAAAPAAEPGSALQDMLAHD